MKTLTAVFISTMCAVICAGCGGRSGTGWSLVGESSCVLDDYSAGEPGISIAGFIDEDRGIAIGNHVLILRTDNGGRDWDKTSYPLGFTDLDALEILDGKHAWTTGGFGIRMTGDGGRTWNEVPFSGRMEITGHYISFADTMNGWYGIGSSWGYASPLLATADGGRTWKSVNVPADAREQIMAIDLLGRDTGYLLLRKGEILKTSDGGKSWSRITLPLGGRGRIGSNPGAPIDAVRFIDERKGTVVMHFETPRAYAVFETADGGRTWKESALPAADGLRYGNVFLSHDARFLTINDLFTGKIYLFRRD